MKWTPEDTIRPGMVPGGFYDAEVIAAEEGTTFQGDPSIKLTLRVFGDEVTFRQFDDLTFKRAAKLEDFCAAAGLMSNFESCCLEAVDCLGKQVRVEMSMKVSKKGFPWIARYHPPAGEGEEGPPDALAVGATAAPGADPDIPF